MNQVIPKSQRPEEISLHPDRLFPSSTKAKEIARNLYDSIKHFPIISPHGHTDPSWFADNKPFKNATELLLTPDHYVLRMLYSQGVSMQDLGISPLNSNKEEQCKHPMQAWRLFAKHYHCFLGTPSQLWMNHVFYEVFGLKIPFNEDNADTYYTHITDLLKTPEYLPQALFKRFNIEVIATTESPLDDLKHHIKLNKTEFKGKIITAFRPDPVIDPEYEGFANNIKTLSQITKIDTTQYEGYLAALKQRRAFFIAQGATSTDHGHPTPATADLTKQDASNLYDKILTGSFSAADAELFRAQMLTEMATMSIDDGMVMQIHPGVYRNHNPTLFTNFGRDKGADIPQVSEYVTNLKPLLDKYGNNNKLTVILFTLDESTYSRELAPLAGHYPCLKLGPPWWFHDSPEAMKRYREQTTESAGFYNTVGFNDDTRAFLSIPARHDVARRMDCAFLANLVSEHRITFSDAKKVAADLTYNLAKKAYKLG